MAEDKNGKSKAIDIALGQIEKQFGKGSIMRLGSRETLEVPSHSHRLDFVGCGAGSGRFAARAGGRDLWSRILR